RVADRVVANVADVQRAAGIGEHLQYVKFLAAGILFGLIEGGVLPALVPLQLDLVVVVRLLGHNFFKVSTLRRSSPSSSTGVSRMNGFKRSFGCARMRRNP